MDSKNGCNFIVIGASGDLSRKKIIPALFSLYVNGFLPKEFNVIGYARTEMDENTFRKMAEDSLKSKYEKEPENLDRIPAFLQRCTYVFGQYDSVDDFKNLKKHTGGE